MTSVDSGVETGNDSNDSSILFELVQHDGQQHATKISVASNDNSILFELVQHDGQQHATKINQVVNKNVAAVANFSIDMDNIKWPTQIGLSWYRNLQENYNYENRGNSLEDNLVSSNAGKLSLPISCCHEVNVMEIFWI